MPARGVSPNLSGALPSVRAASRSDIAEMVRIEDAVFPTDRLSRRSLARLVAAATASVLVAGGSPISGYAVLLARRVEVRACSGEIGRATADRMHVNAMVARWQAAEAAAEAHPASFLGQRQRANDHASGVTQFRLRSPSPLRLCSAVQGDGKHDTQP